MAVPASTVSPLTTSRKLIVAAMLLGGGYGVAFVLGSLAELVLPGSGAENSTAHESGLLAGLRSFVPERQKPPEAGVLIPETEFAAHHGSASDTRHAADQPTWLASSTEAAASMTVASQPACAAAPPLSNSQPILPVIGVGTASSEAQATPKARITNVASAAIDSKSQAASPWDRWPRWNSSEATASGPVAATFQDLNSAKSQPVQAAFNHAEVVRRNSPPLDPGAAPETAVGRTHVVVDGDSLAKLASRYLDDSNLGEEIYRLNRDVLSNPALLPIGVELRIPDNRMADSSAAFPASRDSAAAKPVPSGMVPVEWTPKPFGSGPRAELLRPIPAGRAD